MRGDARPGPSRRWRAAAARDPGAHPRNPARPRAAADGRPGARRGHRLRARAPQPARRLPHAQRGGARRRDLHRRERLRLHRARLRSDADRRADRVGHRLHRRRHDPPLARADPRADDRGQPLVGGGDRHGGRRRTLRRGGDRHGADARHPVALRLGRATRRGAAGPARAAGAIPGRHDESKEPT